MRGKAVFKAGLVVLGIFSLFFGFQQVMKYRALRSLTVNAILECRENLIFLYDCEALIKREGNETAAMVQAQSGVERQLKSRDINALLNAGIDDRKKEILKRAADKIAGYNTALTNAFYGSPGPGMIQPDNPAATGEMIKEFETLVEILGK